jgi:hypothetical protein
MMPGMATQPYSKKKARQPGMALSAALKGSAAAMPNPQDPNRELQKNAPKYGRQVREVQRRRQAGRLSDALNGTKQGGPDPEKGANRITGGSLRSAVSKPANQASRSGSTRQGDGNTISGSLRDAVAETTLGRRKNTTKNERAGQSFREFTRSDMPGYTFHDYGRDPKTGKRRLVRVKTKTPAPLKGVDRSGKSM